MHRCVCYVYVYFVCMIVERIFRVLSEVMKYAVCLIVQSVFTSKPLFSQFPCLSLYQKPSNVSQLVDFLHQVSLSAPKTSVLYYQFPVITGVSFDMYDVLVNARHRGLVPNLRGSDTCNDEFDAYVL